MNNTIKYAFAFLLASAVVMAVPTPRPGGGGGGTTIGMNDDIAISFGTSTDAACEYDTAVTPDSMVCYPGADSRVWYFIEASDGNTDWAKTQQTNPTVCVQSADQTTVTDRICLAHDQTNGLLTTDGGDLVLDAAAQTNLADSVVVGSATEAPLGTLHVFTSDTTATVSANADDFVVESENANGGMTIAVASLGVGHLYFATDADNDAGGISYNSNSSVMTFRAGNATAATIDSGIRILDDASFWLGTGNDVRLVYDTSNAPDSAIFGVSADSRALIIAEIGDIGSDLMPGAAALTNPTLIIRSADATDANDWISLAMDQTNGVIDVGQGGVSVPDGLIVGTDSAAATKVGNILTGTATLDFPSTAISTCDDLTITVTGADTTNSDACFVGAPNGSVATGSVFTCWPNAADTITVRHCSIEGTADPASGTFRVTVFDY